MKGHLPCFAELSNLRLSLQDLSALIKRVTLPSTRLRVCQGYHGLSMISCPFYSWEGVGPSVDPSR